MTEYIAATVPAKINRVSGTTLFHVAMLEFGDPLRWTVLAGLNGLTDPWIFARVDIKVPPIFSSVSPTGVLGL